MTDRPARARFPDGRLGLRHGPIELVIGAEGAGREAALAAAERRFATILSELAAELPALRRPPGAAPPAGATARRMWAAVLPHAARAFVTPMAAVAGAVAEEILAAMTASGDLRKAYVNDGGDIALHLAPGETWSAAIRALGGAELGRFTLRAGDGIAGIATSGRGGRSLSLGVAESVTALAATAAAADAAATLLANAVDLPGHPSIRRAPARRLQPDSDLGDRLATVEVGPLSAAEADAALARGLAEARRMRSEGLIEGALLHLAGRTALLDPARSLADA